MASGAAKDDQEDWYEVMQLDMSASSEEVQKKYRKLSLKYHPDRNKAPEARHLFERLTKAKEFLLDPVKRAEYDSTIRHKRQLEEHRRARDAAMDGNRKRLKKNLHEAEQQARAHAEHKKRTVHHQKEVEADLRRRGREQRESHAEFMEHRKQMAKADPTRLCQVKVKWQRSGQSHSDDTIYQMFREFGAVEDVTMVEGSGSSCVVTFASPDSARRAVDAFAASQTLRVTLIGEVKKAAVFTHSYTANNPKANPSPAHVPDESKKEVLKAALAFESAAGVDQLKARENRIQEMIRARAKAKANMSTESASNTNTSEETQA